MKEGKSIVDIDLGNLHTEWKRQVKMRRHYGRLVAEAKLQFAEAKAQFELVYAKLDLAIRSDPSEYGLNKATDKSVESAIRCQQKYQKAQALMNGTRFQLDKLQVMVDTLEHRKPALEGLISLYLSGYWADHMKLDRALEEDTGKYSRDSGRRQRRD